MLNNSELKSENKEINMQNNSSLSLMDKIISDIKSNNTNNNESVLKMLNISINKQDESDGILKILSVAIFHKNIEIVKLIIKDYSTSIKNKTSFNPIFLYNAILPKDSKNNINESKDNIRDVICPYPIMAGIGGDIKIFQYLLKEDLINSGNINSPGFIGLTKQNKKVFHSNIIGACAYYGNSDLLSYILKKYNDLTINCYTTENEYYNFTPVFLAIIGLSSDKQSKTILQILHKYKARFDSKDSNGNNIIHITIEEKKILCLEYLLDELDNSSKLLNEENYQKEKPYSLAQKSENEKIIEILDFYIKNNKDKFKNDNEKEHNKIFNLDMLNTYNYNNFSDYDSNKFDEDINSNNEINIENNNYKEEEKEEIKIEKKEIKREKSKEEEKEEEKKEDIEEEKEEEKKEEIEEEKEEEKEEKEEKENIDNHEDIEIEADKFNNHKKNDFYIQNKNNTYNKYLYDKSHNKYIHNINNIRYKNNYRNNNKIYSNDFNNNKKKYMRNRIDQRNNNYNDKYHYFKKERGGKAIEIVDEKNESVKEEENTENETKKYNEEYSNNKTEYCNDSNKDNNIFFQKEYEESSYGDENFLDEIDEKEKVLKIEEYKNLYKKYIELERKVNNLEKEKMELNKCIQKIYLNNNNKNKKEIPNNKEKINSLLSLVNTELEKKDKYIKELKNKTKMADLTGINNFDKDKLNEYKDLYKNNLKIINDILEQNEYN